MGGKSHVMENNIQKVIIINVLFGAAIIIMLLGTYFSAYSLMHNVSFKVLNTSVHGAVFGLTVIYLGLRYFLSVTKLKKELFKSTSKFSWDNFKKK